MVLRADVDIFPVMINPVSAECPVPTMTMVSGVVHVQEVTPGTELARDADEPASTATLVPVPRV